MKLIYANPPLTNTRICSHCGREYKTLRGMYKHAASYMNQKPRGITAAVGLGKNWAVEIW